ncbi:Endonuclease/exonuclease/phosphatase [Chytridium lagenaria]|nr:Endonuclease/exonuclease/phosphatase [Chytridium lagenaria]
MAALRVLSFNVSGDEVPHTYQNRGIKKWDAFAALLADTRPHLLALQEASENIINRIEQDTTFQLLTTADSHCLKVATFVDECAAVLSAVNEKKPPLCMTPFKFHTDLKPSVFVNCHLPPYNDGAASRLQMLEAVSNAVLPFFHKALVCGDMNMREPETGAVTKLGLRDAFLLSGSPNEHKFTWDSLHNDFHPKNGSFRGFRCRFDRVFLKNMAVTSFEVQRGRLLQVPGYISDHYALFTSCI